MHSLSQRQHFIVTRPRALMMSDLASSGGESFSVDLPTDAMDKGKKSETFSSLQAAKDELKRMRDFIASNRADASKAEEIALYDKRIPYLERAIADRESTQAITVAQIVTEKRTVENSIVDALNAIPAKCLTAKWFNENNNARVALHTLLVTLGLMERWSSDARYDIEFRKAVAGLQIFLASKGRLDLPASGKPDSAYGPETHNALKTYLSDNGGIEAVQKSGDYQLIQNCKAPGVGSATAPQRTTSGIETSRPSPITPVIESTSPSRGNAPITNSGLPTDASPETVSRNLPTFTLRDGAIYLIGDNGEQLYSGIDGDASVDSQLSGAEKTRLEDSVTYLNTLQFVSGVYGFKYPAAKTWLEALVRSAESILATNQDVLTGKKTLIEVLPDTEILSALGGKSGRGSTDQGASALILLLNDQRAQWRNQWVAPAQLSEAQRFQEVRRVAEEYLGARNEAAGSILDERFNSLMQSSAGSDIRLVITSLAEKVVSTSETIAAADLLRIQKGIPGWTEKMSHDLVEEIKSAQLEANNQWSRFNGMILAANHVDAGSPEATQIEKVFKHGVVQKVAMSNVAFQAMELSGQYSALGNHEGGDKDLSILADYLGVGALNPSHENEKLVALCAETVAWELAAIGAGVLTAGAGAVAVNGLMATRRATQIASYMQRANQAMGAGRVARSVRYAWTIATEGVVMGSAFHVGHAAVKGFHEGGTFDSTIDSIFNSRTWAESVAAFGVLKIGNDILAARGIVLDAAKPLMAQKAVLAKTVTVDAVALSSMNIGFGFYDGRPVPMSAQEFIQILALSAFLRAGGHVLTQYMLRRQNGALELAPSPAAEQRPQLAIEYKPESPTTTRVPPRETPRAETSPSGDLVVQHLPGNKDTVYVKERGANLREGMHYDLRVLSPEARARFETLLEQRTKATTSDEAAAIEKELRRIMSEKPEGLISSRLEIRAAEISQLADDVARLEKELFDASGPARITEIEAQIVPKRAELARLTEAQSQSAILNLPATEQGIAKSGIADLLKAIKDGSTAGMERALVRLQGIKAGLLKAWDDFVVWLKWLVERIKAARNEARTQREERSRDRTAEARMTPQEKLLSEIRVLEQNASKYQANTPERLAIERQIEAKREEIIRLTEASNTTLRQKLEGEIKDLDAQILRLAKGDWERVRLEWLRDAKRTELASLPVETPASPAPAWEASLSRTEVRKRELIKSREAEVAKLESELATLKSQPEPQLSDEIRRVEGKLTEARARLDQAKGEKTASQLREERLVVRRSAVEEALNMGVDRRGFTWKQWQRFTEKGTRSGTVFKDIEGVTFYIHPNTKPGSDKIESYTIADARNGWNNANQTMSDTAVTTRTRTLSFQTHRDELITEIMRRLQIYSPI